MSRPWRIAVAGGEIVCAGLLVVMAWWVWEHGTVVIHLGDAGDTTVTRFIGSRLAEAIGAATLAGLAVLDAVRRLITSAG